MHAEIADKYIIFDPDYKMAVIGSIGLHLLFVFFCIFGLPHLKSNVPRTEAPITIEFIEADFGEFTQTDKIPDKTISKIPIKKKKPELKTPVRTPPKMTHVTPPDLSTPKPVEMDNSEVAATRNVVPPDLNAVSMPDKDEIEKIKAPIKNYAPKSTPLPNKRIKPPKKQKDSNISEEEFNLDSILINLNPDDTSSEPAEEAPAPLTGGESAPLISKIGDSLTVSEQDAILSQLNGCWIFNIGARNPENLIVNIKIFVNPDRTFRDAKIVDQNRFNNDSFFRSAAESALRIFNDPNCKKLNLPPEKHQVWDVLNINLDPRNAL